MDDKERRGELIADLRRQISELRAENERLRAGGTDPVPPSPSPLTDDESVQLSERRHRTLFDQKAVGVGYTSIGEGRWLQVNRKLAEMLGYDSPDELIGRNFREMTHPDDLADDLLLAPALDSGEIAGIAREKRYLCKDGSAIWVNIAVSLVHDRSGAPRHRVVLAQDISERKRVEEALKASEAVAREKLGELEALYRAAPIGLGLLGRDLRYQRVNHRLAELNGAPAEAHIGRAIWDVVMDPGIRTTAEPLLRTVLETGNPVLGVEMQGATRRAPGVSHVWMTDFYPLKAEDGSVFAVGLIVSDVTEQKRAEEQRRLLLDELNHRVRNTLASVQSIATQTARHEADVTAFQTSFLARLRALAQAHGLLSQTEWQGAELYDVLQVELAPHVAIGIDDRLRVEGPALRLGPRAALTLGLVLHELATNAAKYGAWSRPGGCIHIAWTMGDDGGQQRLRLEWREQGGPPARRPKRRGFGSMLIERSIRYELDGAVEFEFAPAGLRCTIDMPRPDPAGG